MCWEQIQPCEVHSLASSPEAQMYYWTLPEHIRRVAFSVTE